MVVYVIFLLLISLTLPSNINFIVCKSEKNTFSEDEDNVNTIQLVLKLIYKLRNYQNIQDIENDEELENIGEELKSLDCGCEDELTIKWRFPIVYLGLLYLYITL